MLFLLIIGQEGLSSQYKSIRQLWRHGLCAFYYGLPYISIRCLLWSTSVIHDTYTITDIHTYMYTYNYVTQFAKTQNNLALLKIGFVLWCSRCLNPCSVALSICNTTKYWVTRLSSKKTNILICIHSYGDKNYLPHHTVVPPHMQSIYHLVLCFRQVGQFYDNGLN